MSKKQLMIRFGSPEDLRLAGPSPWTKIIVGCFLLGFGIWRSPTILNCPESNRISSLREISLPDCLPKRNGPFKKINPQRKRKPPNTEVYRFISALFLTSPQFFSSMNSSANSNLQNLCQYILPGLSTVHRFLYVHFRTTCLRIRTEINIPPSPAAGKRKIFDKK